MTIIRLTGLFILITAFIIGCSGNQGKIDKQWGVEDGMTLEELSENWEEYTIYYAYRWSSRPSAIMFDPKSDDKKLVGDSWYLIEDQEALSETIRIIKQQYDYARVGIIQGPDNQAFGYIYYPHWVNLPIKVVDEQTLYVSTMEPHQSAP